MLDDIANTSLPLKGIVWLGKNAADVIATRCQSCDRSGCGKVVKPVFKCIKLCLTEENPWFDFKVFIIARHMQRLEKAESDGQ